MTHTRTRIRALTMTLTLFAAVAVSVVAFPAAAQARCIDVNAETISHLRGSAGTIYATENPVDGTCNGNTQFRTYIQANLDDYRVSLHLKDGDRWYSFYGGYDQNLYYVDFNDSNSYTHIHLCVDNVVSYTCGWGYESRTETYVTHDYFGENSGF